MLRGESKWQQARDRGIPNRFEGNRPRRLDGERPRPQPLLAQLSIGRANHVPFPHQGVNFSNTEAARGQGSLLSSSRELRFVARSQEVATPSLSQAPTGPKQSPL